jgi:hypothetical protein
MHDMQTTWPSQAQKGKHTSPMAALGAVSRVLTEIRAAKGLQAGALTLISPAWKTPQSWPNSVNDLANYCVWCGLAIVFALADRHVAGWLLLGMAFAAVAQARAEGDAAMFDANFLHFDLDRVARIFDVLVGECGAVHQL